MGKRASLLIIWLLLGSSVSACAQDLEPPVRRQQPAETQNQKPAPAPKLEPDRTKFALIISGIGGEEAYSKQFHDWATGLRQALVEKLGFAEDQTHLLLENPGEGQLRATKQDVEKAFGLLKGALKPDNPLFIFFIGHGSYDGKQSKFNLAGPDLTAEDYAKLLKSLPTKRVTIINMASASGEFIKPISGKGTIIITATRSGQEQNATRFPEFFIAALGKDEADTDKNGRISVLEAFDYATKLTNEWYEQQGRLVTEHALIDDNGDGVGHQKAEAGDGALAKTTYLDSLPQQQAGGDPALAKLFAERLRIEGEIEQLKARKESMKAEEYEAALEKLLIELATLNETIRAKQK